MNARRVSRAARAAVLAALAASLAACAATNTTASDRAINVVSPTKSPASRAEEATASTAPPTSTTTRPDRCEGQVSSYRHDGPLPPPGAMPPASAMETIANRQPPRLIVGVDENSPFLSEWDPIEGRFVGLEADLAREIARAIFGNVGDIDERIQFVTVTTEEKFEVVKSKGVDLMISVPTMSCDRWNEGVNFSIPYWDAYQQIAVLEGSSIKGQSDLSGARVCVTSPSSSLNLLDELNANAGARIDIVEVPTRPACLIKLEDGEVDAIVLPSSIIAGLADQDPTLVPIETPLRSSKNVESRNTYGIVTNPSQPDLTRFVNGVLEQLRANGRLSEILDTNLPETISRQIPPAGYRD
jgi:polar amino acid transport system substrate-binding protein